jgi:uncharacterized protein (DUF2249 family)/quercetin dioxygenase-like cupin family protein
MSESELDVREIPKPQRHPLIFERFGKLAVGESFVLVNNHDPKHLRDEFERDQPGAFGWDYVTREHALYRIRISRVAEAPAPRLLCDVAAVLADDSSSSGAAWSLPVPDRQLDANVVRLPPGGRVDEHVGPDLDVLVHVLAGSGEVTTVADTVPLTPGALVWLPRRSRRAIAAGRDGLAYLTVHRRRPALSIATSP